MPLTISGLPLHVLVVHAVVVLVPLAALGTAAIALWPAARRRYGWLVVGVTAVATAAIPVATSSGEDLRSRLADSSLIAAHAELADQLLVFVICLLVVSAGFMTTHQLLSRREAGTGPGTALAPVRSLTVVRVVAAVLTVVFAAIALVQVVRIGESGARAAWSDTQYVAAHHPQHAG